MPGRLFRNALLLGVLSWLAACGTAVLYQDSGALALREPPSAIHLPEDQLSQLVFKFKTVGGNYSGLTSYSTLLRPRAGHTYAATVTYDAGLYDVEIREIDPHGGPGRKIEHRSLSECHRA